MATTNLSSYYKAPVSEMVGVLPSNPSTGRRVILTTDQRIYEFNGTTWVVDEGAMAGAMCALLKEDEVMDKMLVYSRYPVAMDLKTVWDVLGDFEAAFIFSWNDRVYVVRNYHVDDDYKFDMLRFDPITYDSDRIYRSEFENENIGAFCKDGIGNLYMFSMTGVVYKFDSNEAFDNLSIVNESFGGDIENPWIVAHGAEVWYGCNIEDEFQVYRIKRGEITQMTSDLLTCLGVISGVSTKGASVDGDFIYMALKYSSADYMVKYSCTTGAIVRMTETISQFDGFAVKDGYLYNSDEHFNIYGISENVIGSAVITIEADIYNSSDGKSLFYDGDLSVWVFGMHELYQASAVNKKYTSRTDLTAELRLWSDGTNNIISFFEDDKYIGLIYHRPGTLEVKFWVKTLKWA